MISAISLHLTDNNILLTWVTWTSWPCIPADVRCQREMSVTMMVTIILLQTPFVSPPAVTESEPEWPDDDDYERGIEDVLITSRPCLSHITRIHHHSWSGHKKRSSDYNRGCPQKYKLELTSVMSLTRHTFRCGKAWVTWEGSMGI